MNKWNGPFSPDVGVGDLDGVMGVKGGHEGLITKDAFNLATLAGAGITSGTGTICKSGVEKIGGLIRTTILIDLTGLNSQATDLDIIGVNGTTLACHIGQITAKRNGTIIAGDMVCHEVPAGGDPNVALYSATEATGVEDGGIAALTETLLCDPAADWTAGLTKPLTGWPAAGEYLYLVQGDATGTNATYTAGRFLITLWGYPT